MKIPLRLAGKLVLQGLDLVLAAAQRIDEWNRNRKARKGWSFQDVQNVRSQIDRATRSRAPTVKLPRNGQ